MANDCLVTKLKATVDNSNLKKLGVIKMHVTVSANAIIAMAAESIALAQGMKLKAYGDGYFTDSTRAINMGKEINFTGTAYPAAGEYDIEIINKYNVATLSMNNITIKDIDFSDFAYTDLNALAGFSDTANVNYNNIPDFNKIIATTLSNRLGKLNIDNFAENTIMTQLRFNAANAASSQVSGNIGALAGKPSMTNFQIKQCIGITGDIAQLGTSTGLTRIEIYRTSVSGSIEGLAAAQVAAGRTSGSLAVFYSAPVTHNGESPLDAAEKTITFDSSLPNGYSIA